MSSVTDSRAPENPPAAPPATLLHVGLAGMALSLLCCFTPLLLIALGAMGLAAWSIHLDTVLLPLLAGFTALTAYALWRRATAARTMRAATVQTPVERMQ